MNVMEPFAQTLDLLQSEEIGFMGYLLPRVIFFKWTQIKIG
jgi:hypothetical protein